MTDTDFDLRLAQLRDLLKTAPSLTCALQWWTGQDLVIQVLDARRRMLRVEEYITLEGRGFDDMTGYERVGMLRTERGGHVVALTRALVLPDRIPEEVRALTGIPHPNNPEITRSTSMPLGTALTKVLGDRFARTDAAVWSMIGHVDGSDGDRLAMGCSATLMIDYQLDGLTPVGLSGEELTCDLVTRWSPPGDVADFLATEAADRTCPA